MRPSSNATPPGPRAWQMYAHRTEHAYLHVLLKADQLARYGTRHPVVPVTLTEDPDGDYLGWIATGEDHVTRVQRASMFDVQFIHGAAAEERAGRGTRVRLRVETR